VADKVVARWFGGPVPPVAEQPSPPPAPPQVARVEDMGIPTPVKHGKKKGQK